MLFIVFALLRVCHGPQEYVPLSPFLGPPCAASPAPSPARRRCGGTANEAGQGHWDNHLSATVGDPAQRSCWPGRLNPGVFPMSPISGAHQERARRAADLGLRRLGASELSEAGKCLGNDFPHDSRRRGQPAGVTKGRKTLPSGGPTMGSRSKPPRL